MTMLHAYHQDKDMNLTAVQVSQQDALRPRRDKNRKHNYPKTRKKRTIDYGKKIENDDFIFEV